MAYPAKTVVWAFLFTLFVHLPSAAQQNTSVRGRYEDSAAGLKHLIQDTLKATKENDQTTLSDLTSSMVIPDPETWFAKVFGAPAGMVYADRYQGGRGLSDALVRDFQDLLTQHFDSVDVTRFVKACDDKADENEYPVLLSRQEPEPLSVVIFRHDNAGQSLRFFAYIDGAFRFAGKLEPYPNSRTLPVFNAGKPVNSSPSPLKVPGGVQGARTIKRVNPIYPPEARQNYLQGEVVINTIISKEGEPKNLQVMKGRCVFAKSALDAVRQWRYTPTLLNGAPVEVSTTITVTFSLP
jgi:TonB family protein